VHIAYYDSADGELEYAAGSSGSWSIETVDSSRNVGSHSSVAVDSSDAVHISYRDSTLGDLKYATDASGSWKTRRVDRTGSVGAYSSIAVDSWDDVHISYYDGSNGALKYATDATGSWQSETVDDSDDVGKYTSIALDSSGDVHISYYDTTSDDLEYATGASSSWSTETVDDSGNVGEHTSIAHDSSGNVHISYYDVDKGNLKYATNTSSWAIETVASTGNVGEYTSIAFDSSGNVHISYYDATNGDLKYATNASGSWTTETVDSSGNVGQYSSIALHPSGSVHISYYKSGPGDLKYATNVSGSWTTETADSSGDVGEYSSIAPDSSNNVHISYRDSTNGDLKYATKGIDLVPNIAVSPTSHDFGSVVVGGSSAPLQVTISNTGSQNLVVSSMSLSDTLNFTFDASGGSSTCGTTTPTILPGSSCMVAVTFNPTSEGTFNATLTVTSNDPDTPSVDVTLSGMGGVAGVTVLSPNGGETIASGSTHNIQWAAPPEAVTFTVKYSLNKGRSWKIIAKGIASNPVEWQVPAPKKNKTTCLVMVTGYNAAGKKVGKDTSDGTFTIEVLTVTSPNGGETLTSGDTHTITWANNGTKKPVAKVVIKWTPNGRKWKKVATLAINQGSHVWNVPPVTKVRTRCRVQVILQDARGKPVGKDMSDGDFTVQPIL
jgi:hypothetical protein